MEHRILKSYVTNFAQSSQITGQPPHKQFEYFSNYVLMSSVHPEAFSEISNLSDVDVDTSGTFGIDAIGIFINDNLIQELEDIDSLVKSRNIDVKVMFIQSKTSKSVDTGDILKFIEAVKVFLSSTDEYEDTNALARPKNLLNYIMSTKVARSLNDSSPRCEMMYCYAGNESISEFIETTAEGRLEELSKYASDFKDYSIEFWNADSLIDSYKQVENQFEIEIKFKNNLSLDDITNVEQAYIGYIDAAEFLKLVTNPNGEMRRNVFYDNVRDFQGLDNQVNAEIGKSIADSALADKFVLFNNGVTAVAAFLKNLGANRFILRNYQIVNGCQTSNVLFANKESPQIKDIQVPIKMVHTNDTEVVSRIIRANNRQTPVPNEAFLTLETWHKKLQEFFSIESKRFGDVLFYERRSKEFTLLPDAPERKRVFGLHSITRSFAAVFLQKPHMVMANNTNEIIKSQAPYLFKADHKYGPYLASAMLMFKLHELLDQTNNSYFAVKHRYQLAMLYCCCVGKSTKIPLANQNKAADLADSIGTSFNNPEVFKNKISDIIEFIKKSRADFVEEFGYNKRNPPLRSSDFTDFLVTKIHTTDLLR